MENIIIDWIKRVTFNGGTVWRQDAIDFVEFTWPVLPQARRQILVEAAVAHAPANLRWSLL